jgi:hypothetical protein
MNGATINLGAAFNVGSPQNVEFRYGVVPQIGPGVFVGHGVSRRGFVRYVTSGGGSESAVPEPTSILVLGTGLAFLAVNLRGSKHD